MVVDKLDTTFAALSDPTRRAVIERLSHGPASVHGLTEPFALSQQMISKHIACLVRARIVIKTKRGRESICTLRPEAIKTVSDWAISYRQFWDGGEYHEIVLHEKIVSSMYFSDSKGNRVEPEQYGIEHEAIEGVHDVILFEDIGNGQTRLTFTGN